MRAHTSDAACETGLFVPFRWQVARDCLIRCDLVTTTCDVAGLARYRGGFVVRTNVRRLAV
jgi:hypothetical protein